MYTQCTYKCALSKLRECMLLSYHFYFLNLDNAFLKFWLTDLCVVDHKFIFLNCSYWLLGKLFLAKVKVKLACRRVTLTFLARKTLENESKPLLSRGTCRRTVPQCNGAEGLRKSQSEKAKKTLEI